MRSNRYFRSMAIFLPIVTIVGLIFLYLPINLDDGSVIINEFRLENSFPKLTFDNPVDFQNAGDGSNRNFVVEQPGRIRVFDNNPNVTRYGLFLDITDRVVFGGEMGLLGLAFHPNYAENGYIYLDYTADDPRRTVISRFTVDTDDFNKVDKFSEIIILQIDQPYSNHNGGQIAFGPDGYLYVALGDGGLANDPDGNGQDRTTLLGSLLRIDIDQTSQGRNYSVPSDNPFVNNTKGYKEEIYAYGLRNPWRFSFDTMSGKLFVADVGQNRYEEVNLVEKGKNYGWDEMEGKHCLGITCDKDGLEKPIVEYDHNQGISITGGYVYRGSKLPELFGYYLYADYGSGRIWRLKITEDGIIENNMILKDPKAIVSFGLDENNELYICSHGGVIYQIALV
ncbi:MAG: PQQ-dependent sugar dehydrogenase [Candidatus Kariarchaeaceae archaeon]